MKVLLVQGTSSGGVGRHVARIAGDLARAGHDVVVAGPDQHPGDPSVPAAGSTPSSVPVSISDRPRPAHDARAVRTLRRLARGADVVHAHGLRAGGLAALALGPVLLRPSGDQPRLVVTLHNLPVGGGLVAVASAVLERLVARRADVVLGVSGDLVRRTTRRGAAHAERALVPAPRGADPRTPPADVRRALGVPDGAALAVVVARLAPQKGLPFLLDAVAVLAGQRPADSLVVAVAGEGPLREGLQGRIDTERLPVRLLGARSDVPDLFAAADLAVCPSVWEGQPLVVQEALRLGVPLVATRVGGTPEVAGDAAVLVEHGDVAGLALAVGDLLDDPARRGELSAAARERAAQLPTDTDALAQLERVYRRDRPPA